MTKKPWYLRLHWQIIAGLVLGLVYGVAAAAMGWGKFTSDWIGPWGKIFINLLQLIAVPLVLASIITGVASLADLKKLSRIGGKTIAIYLLTTVISVTIGLTIVNIMKPGHRVPEAMRIKLQETYKDDVDQREEQAEMTKQRGPLQPIVDIVPENVFAAAASNRNMLQIVFFSILVGIGVIGIAPDKSRVLLGFFEGINDVIIRLVDLIMLMAPLGVFALIADTITSIAGDNIQSVIDLMGALGYYCIAVVLGLFLHMTIVYPTMLRLFTKQSLPRFVRAIMPVQLVAFSTSSSGATLPVTMEACEKEMGVSEEVSSFVLPLGATINMDGTALYQAVAAVFIAQSLGMGLDLAAQLTIVLTAVLASIGTAAVPSAGIIMLVIILEAINVPISGIALILGVDRILDMLRTVVNVTGDATVANVVASSEGQLTLE
jgi:Na+/H+-dicarboxylate symporter